VDPFESRYEKRPVINLPRPATESERNEAIARYWKVRQRGGGTEAKEILLSCGILVMATLSCSFLAWVMLEYALREFSIV